MKTCPSCALVFPDESTFCFLTGHTLEPTPDPLVGTTIAGRFLVEALLSETAWSKLYAVRYRLRLEPCCLKLFPAELDETAVQRFQHALSCARRYSHDNLTEVVGGGVLPGGGAYLVHPRSDARPLSASLAQGQLQPSMALGICAQILAGLGRVHDFGGTHGSLRPTNIMRSSNGHIELVHIGLGRVLLCDVWENSARALGAQMYLAPELNSQETQSIAADLYSLGAVAVHLLAGKPPHQADNITDLLSKKRSDGEHSWLALLPPHVPDPIKEWLKTLLTTVPEGRPATAHEAGAALREACTQADISLEPDAGSTASTSPPPPDKLFQRWITLGSLFEKMVEVGFPSGVPDSTNNSLQAIRGRVQTLTEMSKKADYEHGNLHDVMTRAREGRERIAEQMSELNSTAEEIRKDLPPHGSAPEQEEANVDFAAQARELHRELVAWEGRSGFTEPYRELAAAYRAIADVMDAWYEVRSKQLEREQQAAETREKLIEVDGQLEELRDALRIHESNLGAEIEACQQAIAKLGNETDTLNIELVDLASRFSAPLRAKPQLGALFRDLEKTV